MSKTEITAEHGIPQIVMTRDFDAPRDLVFRAYTEPQLLVQWLGPRDLTTTIDRYDVRDGGKWRYVQADSEGREHAFHGIFHVARGHDRGFELAVLLDDLVDHERDDLREHRRPPWS